MNVNPTQTRPNGALDGLRVLDLTRILAGPYCTQALGDLGADVLKVERPGSGDDTRQWGPHYAKDKAGNPTRESAYFLAVNRNKRSLGIDMANAEGAAIIRQLAAKSDVVIENFKVGGLKQYGLDYESLKAENPKLVYCSITGFGQTGPYAGRAGYDFQIQGMGGIMGLTGETNGEPMKTGVAIADVMCGMFASTAILAALRHRDATGVGQWIDMSLLDTQLAWLVNQGSNYLMTGDAPQRFGNAHPNIVPYQVFGAKDGYFILAVGNDAQFKRFCGVAGLEVLGDDARFVTNDARIENREILIGLIETATRTRTVADWMATLESAGVPAGPVNDLETVFTDPQVLHREMVVEMPHPPAGGAPVKMVASPIKMSATPPTYRRTPPAPGEHTDEVLREVLNLSDDALSALHQCGAID